MRQIIKSLSDKRIYRPLLLDNQLECLVISDQDAQKSAAALSVGVGSFLDPHEAQGLAHYLEHMLFMGTEKYPEENEYSQYLSKNAGSSNAYTSLEETNFFFEVSHNAFIGALDRFSRFFIDPLMLDSSSERQLLAVHSQHQKNLQNDLWRKYQLSKHLSKPHSHYHKFSTGDKKSLGNPNLREMLFKFYQSHYSANIMKLVVYGQSDIETLTQEVKDRFSAVKNHQYAPFKLPEVPYDQNFIGKLVKVVPVKDRRTLELTWFLDDQTKHYRNPPSRYVSHLLGHEGEGSLLTFLIGQGLATSLSAGGSDNYSCYSEFEVSVQLTDKGVAQSQKVVAYVFQYIEMLKSRSPEQWVVGEIQRVNKMKFDFMAKSQGMNFCSRTAKNLHKRKMEEIFIYPYLMDEFQPNTITDYLSHLKHDNFVAIAESKTFADQCLEVEPIYQTKFSTQPMHEVLRLPCKIALPPKNTFIPDDLSVLPLGDEKHPRKIYSSERMEAFFKQDHFFSLPKAELNLRIYFQATNTVRDEVVRTLFQPMLKQHLRQFAYMAEMAQLDSQFSFGSYYTLNIKISGFRDSFDRFTQQYLKQILSFNPTDSALFETLKEKQRKEYANYFLNQPYQLCYNTVINALREGQSTNPRHKLQEIETVTLQDVVAFGNNWKRQTYLEYFMAGNLNAEHALRIAKEAEEQVKSVSGLLTKSAIGSIRPVFLPLNKVSAVEEVLQSKEETNNSIIVHYQHEAVSLKTKILQDLALSVVKEPAFDYLRTKQQLGYIVMCLNDDNRGILGLSVLVQSSVKNSYELQGYVDKFVNQILKQKIEKLDEETFNQYKDALHNTKIQKDKNLSAETNRFWGEILKHSYEFQRKQLEAQAIPLITLAEFKAFLNSIFYDSPRVFEMHQMTEASQQTVGALRTERVQKGGFQLFESVQAFRKKMPLYPDYYSHL